jgi:crotonobetaine/carnitine-CoA ligase
MARHTTVYAMFAATAKAAADHPFLIVPARADRDWHPDGVAYSYGETLREVERLRDLYAAAGYGHGHRVSILLENRPEFFFHYLALNALGASIVPINQDYRYDEIAYVLDHSDAELAVVLPHRVEDVAKAAAERDKPLPVVDVHAMPAELPGPSEPPPGEGKPGPETECTLLYTSGTTGRPKGCRHSNLYTLNAGTTYCSHGGLMEIRRGGERFYNPLPLFHINHLNIMSTAAMQTANTLVLPERFSPTRWWREVSAHGVTIIHYLGIVAPMLLNQAPGPADRSHKVRIGIGAGIEPQLHRAFEERFGFPMIEVWGMTETGRIMADCREPRMIGTRAFGRPFPGLEARVVDANGKEVPAGTPGELLVRHSAESPRYGFFSGYLKDEAATEEAWRGGWFHTGDVVRQDASGMLFFVEAHHSPFGREHRRGRDRGGSAGARRGGAGGSRGGAGRVARGGGDGLHRADAGHQSRRSAGAGAVRAVQHAPRLLQGAGMGAVPRQAADDGHAESAEDPDLRAGRRPAAAGRHNRPAGAEEARMRERYDD